MIRQLYFPNEKDYDQFKADSDEDPVQTQQRALEHVKNEIDVPFEVLSTLENLKGFTYSFSSSKDLHNFAYYTLPNHLKKFKFINCLHFKNYYGVEFERLTLPWVNFLLSQSNSLEEISFDRYPVAQYFLTFVENFSTLRLVEVVDDSYSGGFHLDLDLIEQRRCHSA